MDLNVHHKMRSGEPPFCATYSIRQQNPYLNGIGETPVSTGLQYLLLRAGASPVRPYVLVVMEEWMFPRRRS
jgi:hypothetical protein